MLRDNLYVNLHTSSNYVVRELDKKESVTYSCNNDAVREVAKRQKKTPVTIQQLSLLGSGGEERETSNRLDKRQLDNVQVINCNKYCSKCSHNIV